MQTKCACSVPLRRHPWAKRNRVVFPLDLGPPLIRLQSTSTSHGKGRFVTAETMPGVKDRLLGHSNKGYVRFHHFESVAFERWGNTSVQGSCHHLAGAFPQHIRLCFLSHVNLQAVKPQQLKAPCLFLTFRKPSACYVCDLSNLLERDWCNVTRCAEVKWLFPRSWNIQNKHPVIICPCFAFVSTREIYRDCAFHIFRLLVLLLRCSFR